MAQVGRGAEATVERPPPVPVFIHEGHMTVRPTPSGQHPGIGISSAQRASVGSTPQRQSEPTPVAARDSRRDDVQISAAARELQEAGASSPPTPELSAARMQQVLGRMSEGHYDRPDVQQEVLRRLLNDL